MTAGFVPLEPWWPWAGVVCLVVVLAFILWSLNNAHQALWRDRRDGTRNIISAHGRMDRMDGRTDRIEHNVSQNAKAVADHTAQLDQYRRTLALLEDYVATSVEQRMAAIKAIDRINQIRRGN